MILICPSCGSAHSAEGWENDVIARQAFQAALKLPAPVQSALLAYLGVFRPAKQSLRWSTSLKLINELSVIVAQGYIQVQGEVARPCPPHLWAQAMEVVIARRHKLTKRLKNHNYLREVVYDIANQADAGRERTQHQQVLNGNAQAHRDVQPPAAPVAGAVEELSEIERKYIAKYGRKDDVDAASAGAEAINSLADAWRTRDGLV